MWPTFKSLTLLDSFRRAHRAERIVERAFVFVDLAGSTAWSHNFGAMHGCSLVKARLARMCETVCGNDGEIVKLLGDGLHSSFHEPVDAMCAALEIQRDLLVYGTHPGVGFPKARVGLGAGGCVRYVLLDRVDYFGPPVFVAARLAQHGPGGVINIPDDVLGAPGVREHIARYRLETRDVLLRGYDTPTRVHQLHDTQLRTPPPPVVPARPAATAFANTP